MCRTRCPQPKLFTSFDISSRNFNAFSMLTSYLSSSSISAIALRYNFWPSVVPGCIFPRNGPSVHMFAAAILSCGCWIGGCCLGIAGSNKSSIFWNMRRFWTIVGCSLLFKIQKVWKTCVLVRFGSCAWTNSSCWSSVGFVWRYWWCSFLSSLVRRILWALSAIVDLDYACVRRR